MHLNLRQPGVMGHALLTLLAGGVIALPTDTVYGVACDSMNSEAVERLYELKQRPANRPIPILLGDAAQMATVARSVPSAAHRLAERFWPGALTLVLPAAPDISPRVTANTDTIGVRLPDHRFVRHLARALGRPLAATSANLSGQPSATTAEEVIAHFGDALSLVLDGGPTPGNVASSVVDLTGPAPRLLREGPVTLAMVLAALDTPTT